MSGRLPIPTSNTRATAFAACIVAATVSNLALAVPASPDPLDVNQPDGTKVRVHLRGDEFFSWHESTDGYAVVKDQSDNTWKYARPTVGKAGFRAVPGAKLGTADPALQGLKKHDLPDPASLRNHLKLQRLSLQPDSVRQDSPAQDGATAEGATSGDPPPLAIPVHGTKTVKNIVIMAAFADHWDAANNTVLPAAGRVDISEYDNLFNQAGHSSDGAVGSVQDYYREISYGKMTLDSVVTVWVQLPHNEAYYGATSPTGGHDADARQMVADAIAAADAAGFDFSQGDTDGDGWVDCLTVLHSGYDQAGGGGTDAIWSHKGGLASPVTRDNVKMMPYHTESALRGYTGTNITRIGTICHELGHFFGLPDLYDYSGAFNGLGGWCLMSGGSWNGDSGSSPSHMSAWCKVFLGFAKPFEIHSKSGISLPRVEDNPVVAMLRDGCSNGEYFLLENREKTGFDNSASIYPGIVVYHICGGSNNNDLGTWPHPAVKIEEADGNDSLGTSRAAGSQATDVWTASNGIAGGLRDQTGNPSSNTMIYQTDDYLRPDNAAGHTYNVLGNFSAPGATMTFDATTLKPAAPLASALPGGFPVSWRAASQAAKYEIQEGSRVTLTGFSDGAESEDTMFASWYVGGPVQRSTGGAKSGSRSYYFLGGQSITQRTSFKATPSTVVSYWVMSRVVTGNGFLKGEISNDGGITWKTLSTDSGNISSWASRSYGFAALHALGIDDGDPCILHFIANTEYGLAYGGYPNNGYAVDDVSVTGTEIAGYGNWTTLDDNVAGTSYQVPARAAGSYAYRIQAFANGAWQGYGPEGEITVGANHPPVFAATPIAVPNASVGARYSGTLSGLAADQDVNDTLTFTKTGGPAWLAVSSDGALSGTPLPENAGANSLGVRVTDLSGAFDDATVTVFVAPPNTGLSNGLVAYLPFDSDFLDYSGHGNHPAQYGTNSRATGNVGANGYVLNNGGYLGFGQAADLRFPNTTEGNTASFSVSFWAKTQTGAYTGSPAFVSNKDWSADTNTGWGLSTGPGVPGNGYFQMNFKESNANSRDYDATTSGLATGWHHYLVVFQRTGTRACTTYIDGAQADTRAMFATGVNLDGAGLPLNLGQDGTGASTRGSWNGARMDDFGIWRRALSATEAAAIHSAGGNGFGLTYAQAAPVITALSPSATLAIGGSLSMSVTAYSATAATYQWYHEGRPIDGATSATYAKSGTSAADLGGYSVAVTNAYGTTNGDEITLSNSAPAATDLTVARRAGMRIKIALSDLAAAWSDPEGDSLRLTRIATSSNAGATVSRLNVTTSGDGSFVIGNTSYLGYNNPQNVNDEITYTVTDAAGLATEGRILIRTTTDPLSGQTRGITPSGNQSVVGFAGIPGYTYQIQRSTNLAAWTTIHTVTAPASGLFSFTDTFADLGGTPSPSAFYRLAWVP